MRVLLKLAFVFFFFFDENFNDDDDDENECVRFCDVLYSRINSSKELKNISLSLSLSLSHSLSLSLSTAAKKDFIIIFTPARLWPPLPRPALVASSPPPRLLFRLQFS